MLLIPSTLTFGQFVKAIASFLAPILAAWGATTYLPTFGLGWRILFVIFAVVCCLSISVLAATPIEEDRQERASSVADCLKLLGSPFILRSVSSKVFFGIRLYPQGSHAHPAP